MQIQVLFNTSKIVGPYILIDSVLSLTVNKFKIVGYKFDFILLNYINVRPFHLQLVDMRCFNYSIFSLYDFMIFNFMNATFLFSSFCFRLYHSKPIFTSSHLLNNSPFMLKQFTNPSKLYIFPAGAPAGARRFSRGTCHGWPGSPSPRPMPGR